MLIDISTPLGGTTLFELFRSTNDNGDEYIHGQSLDIQTFISVNIKYENNGLRTAGNGCVNALGYTSLPCRIS